MEIKNIASLCSLLEQSGLGDVSHQLLQYVCFRPNRFCITRNILFGTDQLNCRVYFEKKDSLYQAVYYDAVLMREVSMPALTINHVALLDLELEMKSIDWIGNKNKPVFRLDDPSSYERETQIENVVSQLTRLSATNEGKLYADALKVRFWSGTPIEEMHGSLNPIRSKMEVAQRFYIIGNELITVHEAIKFLQNRWTEKTLTYKRKSGNSADDTIDSSNTAGEGKLLRKKRITRRKSG